MNAAQAPGGSSKRRRIAGEVKPADASTASTPDTSGAKVKLPKPKIPKRPKAEATPAAVSDLPTAPPRSDAVRVPRAKPSVTLVILLTLAIASVGFGAFGVWRGVDEWRGESVAEARSAATDAAERAVETIYTYQYDKLDEHTRASQATMTPRFAKTVPPVTRALKELAPLRKTRVKAVVRHAAAKECGDRCSPQKATVLVFFDMASAYADTEKPTVVGPRIEVFMVERNEKWLVNDIKWL